MTRVSTVIVMCFALITLAGCKQPSAVQTGIDVVPTGVTPALTWNNVIVWDEWVRKSPLEVSVFAQNPPSVAPTAIFLPLLPQIQIRDPLLVGKSVGKAVWRTWLQDSPFTILEFQDCKTGYNPAYAMKLARERGAMFAVTGAITDYFDGGSNTGARLGIQIDIYDVGTSSRVWSMHQYAEMKKDRTRDYIFFKAEMRLPSDPMWVVATAIATDMKQPVAAWAQQWQQLHTQDSAEENAAF